MLLKEATLIVPVQKGKKRTASPSPHFFCASLPTCAHVGARECWHLSMIWRLGARIPSPASLPAPPSLALLQPPATLASLHCGQPVRHAPTSRPLGRLALLPGLLLPQGLGPCLTRFALSSDVTFPGHLPSRSPHRGPACHLTWFLFPPYNLPPCGVCLVLSVSYLLPG